MPRFRALGRCDRLQLANRVCDLGREHRRELKNMIRRRGLSNLVQSGSAEARVGRCDRSVETRRFVRGTRDLLEGVSPERQLASVFSTEVANGIG